MSSSPQSLILVSISIGYIFEIEWKHRREAGNCFCRFTQKWCISPDGRVETRRVSENSVFVISVVVTVVGVSSDRNSCFYCRVVVHHIVKRIASAMRRIGFSEEVVAVVVWCCRYCMSVRGAMELLLSVSMIAARWVVPSYSSATAWDRTQQEALVRIHEAGLRAQVRWVAAAVVAAQLVACSQPSLACSCLCIHALS